MMVLLKETNEITIYPKKPTILVDQTRTAPLFPNNTKIHLQDVLTLDVPVEIVLCPGMIL